MSDESATRPELVPIATRILYEDDRVRIWDQVLEPGCATGPHRHDLSYALVTVDGASFEVEPVEGYPTAQGTGILTAELEDRTAVVAPAGAVENARNTGDRPYRGIVVEFKTG